MKFWIAGIMYSVISGAATDREAYGIAVFFGLQAIGLFVWAVSEMHEDKK